MSSWSMEKQNLMYFSCLPFYILSIIGSLFIIINFLSFRDLRTFSFKLVFFIAISDLFRAIAMIIPSYYIVDNSYYDPYGSILCWIQSILGNMSGLSTTLWNACVAHSIRYVFRSKPNTFTTNAETNKLFYKYLCINTCLTVILSVFPIFPLNKNHSYGPAGAWCWIKDDNEWDSIVRIISQYSVQLICFVGIIYVYWGFLRSLFAATSSMSVSRANLMNETIGRLKWFPLILFVAYIPGIINRFSQIILKDHSPKYTLTFIQYGSLSICGLLDALIYSWTKPVKEKYKRLCFRRFIIKNQQKDESSFYADLSDLDDTLNTNTLNDTTTIQTYAQQ